MTKVSYGERRQYALGDALDSVMNYPLRDGLVAFLTGRSTARALADLLLSQRLNYPRPLYYALMNLTASHDVARTRSALALDFDPRSRTRAELAALEITDAMAARGAQLQVLAAAVQFWLPGIPSIYYGDEAGMQGLCDPFNRAPLQMCDTQMLQWYAQLTTLRHAHPALTRGEVAVFAPAGDVLCVLRVIAGGRDAFGEEAEDEALLLIVNRAAHPVHCHAELTCPGAGLREETRLAFVRSEYDCAVDCFDSTHIAIRMTAWAHLTCRPMPQKSTDWRTDMELKLDRNKTYGLALEGGGAKGAYQIGAWKALREAGIRFSAVSGTSVGALNGAMIVMDDLEKAENVWNNIHFSQVMDVDDEEMRRLMNRDIPLSELKSTLRSVADIVRNRGFDVTPLRKWVAEVVDADKICHSGHGLFHRHLLPVRPSGAGAQSLRSRRGRTVRYAARKRVSAGIPAGKARRQILRRRRRAGRRAHPRAGGKRLQGHHRPAHLRLRH